MRIRGTPFITAVVMSAAAMFLIPEAVNEVGPHVAANRGPAAPDGRIGPPAEPGGGPAAASSAPSGPASSAPPLPPIPARAMPGSARTLRAGPVTLEVDGFWSWALLDRRTGNLTGSANLSARSDTASMIKVWIAADHLRRIAERGQTPDAAALRDLSVMIRDSDNGIASRYHRANGGTASITRMVQRCGLTDSRAVTVGSWSTTEVSARDGVRLAACVADGRAAGPKSTGWLLGEMRQVRGSGRFGVITALAPDVAARVAIKNGWVDRRDGRWHIACLAVADEWAVTVLTRYPVARGLAYGTNICKQVGIQLGATA